MRKKGDKEKRENEQNVIETADSEKGRGKEEVEQVNNEQNEQMIETAHQKIHKRKKTKGQDDRN